MVPVAYLGYLAVAGISALALSACGDDGKKGSAEGDAGDAGMAGEGGAAGSAGRGRADGGAGTGGSGGVGGNAGAAGSAGSAGATDGDAGVDGDADAGSDGSSFVDGGTTSIPYRADFIYGSGYSKAFSSDGSLLFSDQNPCHLLGGDFTGEIENNGMDSFSIDMSGMSSIDFCASEVMLPISGGIFDGITLILDNKSNPLSSMETYTITACDEPGDGGVTAGLCSGRFFVDNR